MVQVAEPPKPTTQLHVGEILALYSAVSAAMAQALSAADPDLENDSMKRLVR